MSGLLDAATRTARGAWCRPRAAPAGRRPGPPGRRAGTSRPASPTTSGRAPVSLATTGTPHAIASTTTRPNCSNQPGVGKDGTASTSRPPVEVGQLRPAPTDADQLDAVADAELGHPRAEGASSGPAPATRSVARSRRASGLEQHVDALVGLEPADVPDDGDLSLRAVPGPARSARCRRPAGSAWPPRGTPCARRCVRPRSCTRSARRRGAGPTARASGTAAGSACRCSGRSTGRTAPAGGAAAAAAGSRPSPGRTAPRGCR